LINVNDSKKREHFLGRTCDTDVKRFKVIFYLGGYLTSYAFTVFLFHQHFVFKNVVKV